MTSRREAHVKQREKRLERLVVRVPRPRRPHLAIHKSTEVHLQYVLFKKLLDAGRRKSQNFSLTSEELRSCHSVEDAAIYRTFFEERLRGTWSVRLHREEEGFSFEFERA